jgi:hypothetical protein
MKMSAAPGPLPKRTISEVIPRPVAIANARAALDQARARRDADRAAGRLSPDVVARLQQLELRQASDNN